MDSLKIHLRSAYFNTGIPIIFEFIKHHFGNDIKQIDLKSFLPKKSSDTVFIFGSGYSLNSLSQSSWEVIKKHDSIGLNSFFFSNFHPTFYFYEISKNPEIQKISFDFLIEKNSKSPLTLLVNKNHFKDSIYSEEDFKIHFNNFFLFSPFKINTLNKILLKAIIRKSKNKLLHHASSISFIIDFCRFLGYRNIVLLGVDLNDSRYFYEHPDYLEKSKTFIEIQNRHKLSKRISGVSHEVSQIKFTSNFGCLPIQDYLEIYNEQLRKNQINLYIGNPNSTLSKFLPVFNF